VEEEHRFLYDAFHLLHPSRPVHLGGAGAIPFVEIDAFCRLFGVTAERATFARLLRRLDHAYLQLMETRKSRTLTPTEQHGGNDPRHHH
jgi:hypothetical protein